MSEQILRANSHNKQVGSTAGGTGITSLVSRVAAPGVLGVGIEYGSLMQTTDGTVTTVRGNLLGLQEWGSGLRPFRTAPK